MKPIFFIALFVTLFVGDVCAAFPRYQCGITPTNIAAGTTFSFRPDGVTRANDCTSSDIYVLVGDERKTMLSLILTAKAVNKTICAYLLKCDPATGRPAVSALYIEQW